MFPEPFVYHAKASLAKRNVKGYGDENELYSLNRLKRVKRGIGNVTDGDIVFMSIFKEVLFHCLYMYLRQLRQHTNEGGLKGSELSDMKSPESGLRFSPNLRSTDTLFSKSMNLLIVSQKSAICALFKAKSVNQQTYSTPSYKY